MARRRVATWKYFNGDAELENVRWFHVGQDGRPDGWAKEGGNNARFGTPLGVARPFDASVDHRLDYRSDWLPVEREVRYLTRPDPHQCDWRCMGGKPGGDCWCECGGRNHGRNFRCEIVA